MNSCVLLIGLVLGIVIYNVPGPGVDVSASVGVSTMRAAVFHKYGNPGDVLAVQDWPLPVLQPTDVLIKVRASAINPVDVKIMQSYFKLASPWIVPSPPFVPGFDVAGEVAAVGSDVTGVSVGDAVFAMVDFRRCATMAEYVAVQEHHVHPMPKGATWEEAASLPLVAMTGFKALVDLAYVQPGQSVLVLGASGGTGSFGVQLAKALGARVTATCSARNRELVQALGADEIVDYRTQDWGQLLAGRNFDVVYDCVGGIQHWIDGQRVLKPGGYFVTIVGDVPNNDIPGLLTKGWGIASRQNIFSGFHYRLPTGLPNRGHMQTLTQFVEAGTIRAVVDTVYDLEATVDAMKYVESGRASGKVVVVPGLAKVQAERNAGDAAPAEAGVDPADDQVEAEVVDEAEAEAEVEAAVDADVEADELDDVVVTAAGLVEDTETEAAVAGGEGSDAGATGDAQPQQSTRRKKAKGKRGKKKGAGRKQRNA